MSDDSKKPALLRRPDVLRLYWAGGRTSMDEAMAAGRFPRPVKIGRRAVAWRVSDLEAWLASLEETPAWR